MFKHLRLILVLLTLPALAFAGDARIVPRTVDGRTIYVNDDLPPKTTVRSSASSRRYATLVYWSNVEHRWKKLPRPTPFTMRRARAAAAEVSEFVAARPQGEAPESARHNPNYAALSRGRSVSAEEIDKAIDDAAARNGVDPNLVRAIVKVESNFNPRAVSSKGAMGLMQLMPSTARSLNVENPFDARQNIEGGVRHFRSLMNTFGGNLELSLAAYNAGAGAVQRSGGVPNYSETRNYVRKITDLYGSRTSGMKLMGSAGARPIRVTRDSRGYLVITNE